MQVIEPLCLQKSGASKGHLFKHYFCLSKKNNYDPPKSYKKKFFSIVNNSTQNQFKNVSLSSQYDYFCHFFMASQRQNDKSPLKLQHQ